MIIDTFYTKGRYKVHEVTPVNAEPILTDGLPIMASKKYVHLPSLQTTITHLRISYGLGRYQEQSRPTISEFFDERHQ